MNPLIQKNLAYLIFPTIACFLSLILTRICISILPKFGLVDHPGGRHIHKDVTPKGGGLAIILAFGTAWILFLFSRWNYFLGSMDLKFISKLAYPAIGIFLLGIIDDRFSLRARYKLCGQIIVAVICWYVGFRFNTFFKFELPSVVSFILTTFWIIGFINAFNLIDGLDGLAAGLGIVSCVCTAVIFVFQHAPMNTVVILCLAASCLGFLKYNFHPARIFMGDTGSMFIGFMLAVIGIETSTKLTTFSAVLVPVLAAGVPVFDTFLAIWRRISRRILHRQVAEPKTTGTKIMDGDKEHLHHRLLDQNQSQKITTLYMFGIAVCLGILALTLVLLKDKAQGLVFLIVLGAFVTAIRRLATVELWNSAKALVHGTRQPKRSLVLSLVHPFSDVIILSLTFLISYYLFRDFIWKAALIKTALLQMAYNMVPIIILLHLGRSYKRFWFRASSSDYIKLSEILIIGHIVNIIIQYKFNFTTPKEFSAQYLIYFLLSSCMIVGERMSLRYMRSDMLRNLYLKRFHGGTLHPTLLYGGGMRCRFYLSQKSHFIEQDPVDIVGIIDDIDALRGQYVYGYKVLGNIDDLDAIYNKRKFERLIVSFEKISEEKKQILSEFCAKHNVKLTKLVFQEDEI